MNSEVTMEQKELAIPTLVREAAEEAAHPQRLIEAALAAVTGDVGALFEEEVLDALRQRRATDPADYARVRDQAKKLNPGVRQAELDRLTKGEASFEPSAIDLLVAVAKEGCRLCHDEDRRGVAIIEGEKRQIWFVRGEGFAEWLRAKYYEAHEAGLSDATVAAAVATIEAIGVHRGEKVAVHQRCAKHEGAYFIDLCDEGWRAIKVDETGWEIVNRPPALFTRTPAMRALPMPERDGDIERLWEYVNIPETLRPIVLTWLIESMRPDTPFPVLELVGEQGSAKSTTHRHLRELIDPNKVLLRGSPKTIEDVYVAAASAWIVSYENLSGLTADQQDALCTLSTGGGFATRQHYTNGSEHVLSTKRPVMLNGIAVVATRPDLIERTVHVEMPEIAPDRRREDSDLSAQWQVERPRIFGAVLNLFVKALGILPNVVLTERQRMADFERLGEAVVQARGGHPGDFVARYSEMVREGKARSLENFDVVQALESMMIERIKMNVCEWSGTVGELYKALPWQRGYGYSNWPQSAKGLANQLRRLAPALRATGLIVEFHARSNTGRKVTIRRLPAKEVS